MRKIGGAAKRARQSERWSEIVTTILPEIKIGQQSEMNEIVASTYFPSCKCLCSRNAGLCSLRRIWKKNLEKVNSLASSLSFIEQQSVSKSTKIVELANNFWETIASGRVWVKIIKPSV